MIGLCYAEMGKKEEAINATDSLWTGYFELDEVTMTPAKPRRPCKRFMESVRQQA